MAVIDFDETLPVEWICEKKEIIMEVALNPELEELIAEQVESGNYPSPGEVVREALRLLKEQLELSERKRGFLRRDVQVGLEALERGEYEEYDTDDIQQLASEIKTRGRERLMALAAVSKSSESSMADAI